MRNTLPNPLLTSHTDPTPVVMQSPPSPVQRSTMALVAWQVPILAAIVFVAGLAWLLIARPTVKVQEGAAAAAEQAPNP